MLLSLGALLSTAEAAALSISRQQETHTLGPLGSDFPFLGIIIPNARVPSSV